MYMYDVVLHNTRNALYYNMYSYSVLLQMMELPKVYSSTGFYFSLNDLLTINCMFVTTAP
jgi:hypothetical protein